MYTELNPSIELNQVIDSFWFFKNDNEREHFKLLPDGCTDLIFDLNLSKSFLSGVMTTFQDIDLKPKSKLIGIRFKSENLGLLFDAPIHAIKNLRVDILDLNPALDLSIIHVLNELSTLESKKNTLEVFVQKTLIGNFERHDNLILSVANRIRLLKGKISIENLAKFYHISIRQLQRRFKSYVGLTVKEFSNIIRFINAEKFIKHNPALSLMEIAFMMGYYDHAHMNYEFNRIAGETPSSFR